MDSILAHPAFQSGIAPFVVSLIISITCLRWSLVSGLSIVAGVSISVYLATGFSFEPLTSSRKIILLILLSPVVAILCKQLITNVKVRNNCFAALGALAMLWVFWPVLARNPSEALVPTLAYMIFAAWMVAIFTKLSDTSSISAGAAATSVGFSVGIIILTGASAMLGQMGLSLGAAAAAFLLTQLVFKIDREAGITVTFSSGLIAGLLLPASVVYAKVPWVVLPLIAIVPIFAFYPFEDDDEIWKNTLTLIAVMALPIGFAIYLTVESAGEILM